MSSAKKTIAGAAMIVMAGMALSRVLGFLRWTVITHVFGRNEATDALFAAFTLPDLLYILVSGGALGAAFVPVFTDLRTQNKEAYAWELANGLLNLVNLGVAALAALAMVFAPQLLAVLAPGLAKNPEAFGQAVLYSRLLFPMVFFTSMSGLMNGLLQAMGEFKAPALAWSLYNVFIIGAALLLSAAYGLKAVCFGTVAGAAAMVAVQLPGLIKRGWRPAWKLNLKDPNLQKVVRLFIPAMAGIGLSQVNLMVLPTLFGSFLSKGDIVSLQIANRLILLPLGLFGNAIGMAVFPALCEDHGKGNEAGFAKTMSLGLRASMVLCLPVMVIFMGAPETLIRAMFVTGGKFNIQDAQATALALRWLSLGLVGYVLIQVVTKGFHARQNTAAPLWNNLAFSFLATLPLTAILLWQVGGAGAVCLGLSLGTVMSGLALLFQLARLTSGFSPMPILVSTGKMALAGLPLLGLTLGVEYWTQSTSPGNVPLLTAIGSAGALGGLAYAVLLVAMKEESAGLALRKIPVIGPKLAARLNRRTTP